MSRVQRQAIPAQPALNMLTASAPLIASAQPRTGLITGWKSPVSGLWSDEADWRHGLPGIRAHATIGVMPKGSGGYTVTIATAAAAGTLTVSAGSATLVDAASLTIGKAFNLDAGTFTLAGTLTGGVVDVAQAAIFAGNGTLTGLTFEGEAASDGSLTIAGGVTFAGTGGTGSATITGPLTLLGSQTINNVSIDQSVTVADLAGVATHLVLGPDTTLTATGVMGGLQGADQTGDSIVNQGTIFVGTDTLFTLDTTNFTNQGEISVENQGTLALTGNTTGTQLTTLLRSIVASQASVALADNVVGGSLYGDITAANTTLSAVNVQGSILVDAALIAGNSAIPYGLTIGAGTGFSGSNPNGAALIDVVSGSLVFDPGAALYNADVTLGTVATPSNAFSQRGGITTNGTYGNAENLTIGANATVIATDGFIAAGAGDKITNYGTIDVITPGAFLALYGNGFTNAGTILLSTGADVELAGINGFGDLSASVAQTLINGIDNTGGDISLSAIITPGTLDATISQYAPQESASLDGVNFEGAINLATGTLTFYNGTSFAGANGVGGAVINVSGGALIWGDATPLANADVNFSGGVLFGDSTSAMTISAGATLNCVGGQHISTAGSFVLNGAITTEYRQAQRQFVINATSFTNGGSVALAENNVFSLNTGTATNNGVISINGGASLACFDTNVTNGRTGTLTLDSATGLQASITSEDNSSLTNTGSIVASGAGTASLATVALFNAGAITATAGTLQFLTNTTNDGAVTASSANLSFASQVQGIGTLDLTGTGTIALLAGAVATQTLDFLSATAVADLTTPANFLGQIAGFSAGDQISLLNTTETGYNFAAGVLTVTDGTAIVASLNFTGSYSNAAFSVQNNMQTNTTVITLT